MGTRTTTTAACLVLLSSLATSCTAAGPSDAEMDEWLEARPQAVAEDAVAAMSSSVRTPGSGEADEPAATLSVGQPADVTGLRVECLGDGTLLVAMEVRSGNDDGALELTVECGDGRQEEPFAFPGTHSIQVDVFGDDYVGAVHVEVLGESISPG